MHVSVSLVFFVYTAGMESSERAGWYPINQLINQSIPDASRGTKAAIEKDFGACIYLVVV